MIPLVGWMVFVDGKPYPGTIGHISPRLTHRLYVYRKDAEELGREIKKILAIKVEVKKVVLRVM